MKIERPKTGYQGTLKKGDYVIIEEPPACGGKFARGLGKITQRNTALKRGLVEIEFLEGLEEWINTGAEIWRTDGIHSFCDFNTRRIKDEKNFWDICRYMGKEGCSLKMRRASKEEVLARLL